MNETTNTGPDVLTRVERLYQSATKTMRNLRRDDRLQDDLGLDSLKSMELMVAIEDEFEGVYLFEDDDAQRAETVGDLVALINRRAQGR